MPDEVTPSHAGPIFVDWDNKEKLKQTVKALNQLPASIQELISEVYYVPTSSNQWLVKFYMNDGNTVIASIKTFADKMTTYPAIVKELSSSEKGTIHMEVATYFEAFKSKKRKMNVERQNRHILNCNACSWISDFFSYQYTKQHRADVNRTEQWKKNIL